LSSFNKVIMIGNCTRDPATKQIGSGTSITELGLASNRKWKDAGGNQKEEVCFVDAVAFGKTAETIAKFFHKGDPILLEGRLTYQTWDDKQSGAKRSKHVITIESFSFVGNRSEGGDQQDRPARGRAPSQAPAQPDDGGQVEGRGSAVAWEG
jgi:single-strand DNA-binding protein